MGQPGRYQTITECFGYAFTDPIQPPNGGGIGERQHQNGLQFGTLHPFLRTKRGGPQSGQRDRTLETRHGPLKAS